MRLSSEDTSAFLDKEEKWPPGFRFHPTDEELILYYLKRKICRRRLKLHVIADVDVYKADPDDLPGLSLLKTGDRQWFFFSPRDRKYPNGGRSNRATRHGYWKATGKDRVITCNSRTVGIKKTLVFYQGRAPSGERTDWVMHEYTLDEEELKRCPAQDYYALYKVFKKSGPGPKNGEQYGAPFREEDWADDDKAIVSVPIEQVVPLQQFKEHVSFDNTETNCQTESQINSLDEILNRIADDPLFEPNRQTQPQINGLDDFLNRIANDPLFEPVFDGTVLAAGRDEETHSTFVDPSSVEPNVQERGIVHSSCVQLNDLQPFFNPSETANSQFQAVSEVTFGTNMNGQISHEDFLELDDLIGPEPTDQNSENLVDDLRIEDFDGLCEQDLFEDVSMYFQDADDTEPASPTDNMGNQICDSIANSCPNNFENGVADQVGESYFNNFQTEMVPPISQPYHNSFGNEMVGQFNYQMLHDSDVASQLWINNQNFSMAAPAVANQGSVIPPTSGVVYAGVSQSQYQNQNQNQIQTQNGKGNEGGESWFSSTLWSFVETIPTTPASAAESTVLVNKAFERLSSFGRRGESGKVTSFLKASVHAGNPTATCPRSRNGCNKSVLLFSVIGVLCAILWGVH